MDDEELPRETTSEEKLVAAEKRVLELERDLERAKNAKETATEMLSREYAVAVQERQIGMAKDLVQGEIKEAKEAVSKLNGEVHRRIGQLEDKFELRVNDLIRKVDEDMREGRTARSEDTAAIRKMLLVLTPILIGSMLFLQVASIMAIIALTGVSSSYTSSDGSKIGFEGAGSKPKMEKEE